MSNETGSYAQNIGGAAPPSIPAIESWIKKKNFRAEAANKADASSYKSLALQTQAQIDKIQACDALLNTPAGQELLKQAKEIVSKTNIEHYENPLLDTINALNAAEQEVFAKIDPGIVDALMAPPTRPVVLPSSPFASTPASAIGVDVFVARISYCGFMRDKILVDKGLIQLYMSKLREFKEQGIFDPVATHDVVLKNFKSPDGNVFPSLMNKRIFAYANLEVPGNDSYLYIKLHIPAGITIPDSASVELYISHKI